MGDLIDEFKTIALNKLVLIDSLSPWLLFLLVFQLTSLNIALVFSGCLGVTIFIYRLLHKDTLTYIGYGIAALVLIYISNFFGQASVGILLPDIASDTVLLVVSFVSLFIGTPLVAYSSHVFSGWPLEWFNHKSIKPAYQEATMIWVVFFSVRIAIKLIISKQTLNTIAWLNVLTGTPLTVALLLCIYVFGIWRLGSLHGPSVEEFTNQTPPPWQGQKKGF